MVKKIGIIGCSAEGAALCYRTICLESQQFLGEFNHPEITMHTPPFSDYMNYIFDDNWEGVAQLMIDSSKKVAKIGAEFAICPDNTIHKAFDLVKKRSPIPWLHIAEVVGEKAKKLGYKKLGILGTNYLMTSKVYSNALEKLQIASLIPIEEDRLKINKIIFTELVNHIFKEESREYFNNVILKLKESGCDAVVLGCTEIPLIIIPDDCPLPVLDSTRLLARAAIQKAIF